MSMSGIECALTASRWSALFRMASTPPAIIGCRVLTRPSSISGNCVSSATSRTGTPDARSMAAVPPVDTSSTPRDWRPAPNSTTPVLSVTLISARLIFGMRKGLFCHGVYNLIVPHAVTLIPGDGIGPEVADAAVRAVNATGVSIDWDRVELTADIIEKSGQVLPQHVLDSISRTRIGLKGPVATPVAGGFPSVNVALRKKMDLYANVRPVRTLPGVKTRYMDVHIDMVIFRENTEDVYSGLEHEVVTDVVESLKIITRRASIRIAEAAFRYAASGRRKVTAVHKANIMKLSDGLFLRCCREVAQKNSQIEYKELIVDNAAMQLVIRPETFD